MSYCKIGDTSATVTWKYLDGDLKNFISNIVPIDVTVNYEYNGLGTWRVDTYDDITTSYIASYSGTEIESPVVNGRELKTASTNRLISSDQNIAAGNVRIRNAVFTSPQLGYRIKILDTTGKLLIQDFKEGQAPPVYTVACGTNCPDGYCKIECEAYPGYCCLNEAEIQSLSNQLR